MKRINVKFTSTQRKSETWVVEMRQVSRRNKSLNIDKFNSEQYDLIAVYIGPKDKVILVESTKATKLALYIKENYGEVA